MAKWEIEVGLVKEGSQWVAVDLDRFIAAQGPTQEDALDALRDVSAAQREVSQYEDLPPTPVRYREHAVRVTTISDEGLIAHVRIKPAGK